MAQVRGKGDVKPNKEMIRHMVLNSLRGFNVKFREEYGTMVLCSDAGDPWRRDFFPNYKYIVENKVDKMVHLIGIISLK